MNATLPGQIASLMTDIIKPHAQYAAKYGKPLITYEAGQGMSGGGLALAANRDGGMYKLYQSYLAGMKANGVRGRGGVGPI